MAVRGWYQDNCLVTADGLFVRCFPIERMEVIRQRSDGSIIAADRPRPDAVVYIGHTRNADGVETEARRYAERLGFAFYVLLDEERGPYVVKQDGIVCSMPDAVPVHMWRNSTQKELEPTQQPVSSS